jgi:trk system potassium uptake protein TrkA
MKFVIVGFGRVGMRTARILGSEGHEVVIVETDLGKVDRAEEEGFEAVQGDGGEEGLLDEVGLDDVDAVAGLTGDLNTNFSVCVVGRANGCRTVLRVNEDFSEELYETYTKDVDEIVYPERLGAAGAKTALLGGDFNVLADLTEHLSIAQITIPEGSPVIDTRVVDLDLPEEARIYAHGRAGDAMEIPLPQTRFEAGDNVGVMAEPTVLENLRGHLRGEAAEP